MQQFTADLDSRVRSLPSASSLPLTSVLEAVSNSIDAVRERQATDASYGRGSIEVSILRSPQAVLDGVGIERPVAGFRVTDDGIGFTDERVDSFLRFGAPGKTAPGGPGAGRFTWLAGFEHASISSVYEGPRGLLRRDFDFRRGESGVETASVAAEPDAVRGTSITLSGPYKPKKIPASANDIAVFLAEHFFTHVIDPMGAVITVRDGEHAIDLRELAEYDISDISTGGEDFRLYHSRRSTPGGSSSLVLCANFHPVRTIDLSKEITGLDKSLYDRAGYHYAGFVTGEYLDQHVSKSGDSFDFPDAPQPGSLFADAVSMKDIVDACTPVISSYLKSDLEDVRQERDKKLSEVIHAHPRLKLIEHQKQTVLSTIQPKDTHAVIEKKLRDAQFGYVESVQKTLSRDMLKLGSAKTPARYEELFRKCVSKAALCEQSSSAETAGYRRTVLELMDLALHDSSPAADMSKSLCTLLIRPDEQRADVPSDAHNLWLIDERLTYCAYLASAEKAASDDDNPCPFIGVPTIWGEKDRQIHGSASILLLEPRTEDEYTFSSNPVDAMLDYVSVLLGGNSVDANGNPVVLKTDAQLNLYAICEMSRSLEKVLDLKGLTRTSDGQGFFGYNQEFRAYIEVMSPEKVRQDAVRRNGALFRRLGIDTL